MTLLKGLKGLHFSSIQPYVDYNLLNWASTTTSNVDCIRVILKKSARLKTFKDTYVHSDVLLKEICILFLVSLIKQKTAFLGKL